jgi:hypothetical protein
MKNLYLPLLLCVLIGCKPSTRQDTQTEPSTPASENAQIPFSGNWIHETYLNSIRDQKSPRAAQEIIEECFIRIPEKMNEKTSMVYNFHETGPELKVVQKDTTYTLWELQGDTLNKAVFPVQILDTEHLKIGAHTFVKINPEYGDGQALILEELLFKGTYTSKSGQPIEFKNNGEVSGLGKYNYYHVLTDYMDAGLQIDQVGLGETSEKSDYFGFKFRDNMLELYELRCLTFDKTENRCVEVDFGRKIHSLRKTQ